MKTKYIIIGAGLTGLTCAYQLNRKNNRVLVFEKQPYIGGLATTLRRKHLIFDLGPHKIYTQKALIMRFIKKLLSSELLKHKKKRSLYLFDDFLDYPIRFSQLLTKIPLWTTLHF